MDLRVKPDVEVRMEAADPVEEQESVVEAGQGDQQKIEGVPHIWKKGEILGGHDFIVSNFVGVP